MIDFLNRKYLFQIGSNQELGADAVTLALSENNLALQTYAIGFWKPLPPQTKSYEPLFFHIQSGSRYQSPLLDKNLTSLQNIIGKFAQKSDFMKVSYICILSLVLVTTFMT